MQRSTLQFAASTYYPAPKFGDACVSPTGRAVSGGKWAAKKVSIPRAQRTMEGPALGIMRIGRVYLGDLFVSAFFDAEDGYRVAWKNPNHFDLLSIAVFDRAGNELSMNATGRKALYDAEILERLAAERDRIERWEKTQERLRVERARAQQREDAAAERARIAEEERIRRIERMAQKAAAEVERARQRTRDAAAAKDARRARTAERTARKTAKVHPAKRAEQRIQAQLQWQEQERVREEKRQNRLARIRLEHEEKQRKRRETQENAAEKRILDALRREEEWLVKRDGETAAEREARHEREAAEVSKRLKAEASRVFRPKRHPPPDPTDELAFLSSRQRHDLHVIRRDYPELCRFSNMDVALMLVRTCSRNSTVVTLFNQYSEEKRLECASKYANDDIPDTGRKYCAYNPFIVNVVRREDEHLEALRYGITSKPEIDPIAEREMLQYGICPTAFIPLEEEEEENEHNCRETM